MLFFSVPTPLLWSWEKWHNSMDVKVLVLPKSLLSLQPVACFSLLPPPAALLVCASATLCVAPGSKHTWGQVLHLLGLMSRGFGETPCGCAGCGEQEGSEEETTQGVQIFLLWLFTDVWGEEEGGPGFFLITFAYFKIWWVRPNSPKPFPCCNLLGMPQPAAANSSQKPSDSLFLWRVYPCLGTTQRV